jgi:hypothetical protein
MGKDPGFDTEKAHRYFSADCFNRAWEFIDKADRTPHDEEEMIRLSQASIWHWTQRADCKRSNLSVGYWQASRALAIAGRGPEARHYAQLCLDQSKGETPFLLSYAYEALARAEKVAGNASLMAKYKAEAARLAEKVDDTDDQKLLVDDLATL